MKTRQLKLLTVALLLLSGVTLARAVNLPLPGDYTGEWRGRLNREFGFGVQTQAVHVTISTNGEVILLMTFINPITGGIHTSAFSGAVRRNGTIRGGDNSGRFRAVPRDKGHALRGLWFFPTRYGPVSVLRFFANHD